MKSLYDYQVQSRRRTISYSYSIFILIIYIYIYIRFELFTFYFFTDTEWPRWPQAMVQGGLPQATVQPVAATPSVNVPATVALGEVVLYRDAEAYSASLPRQRGADYGGCRRIKFPASGTAGFLSCCVAYSYVIDCKNCLCTPLTCVLFPLPFFISIFCPFSVCSPCLHCTGCERQGNQWIAREDGHDGQIEGAWVIVDAEKKTIAYYGMGTGAGGPGTEKPQCYCV